MAGYELVPFTLGGAPAEESDPVTHWRVRCPDGRWLLSGRRPAYFRTLERAERARDHARRGCEACAMGRCRITDYGAKSPEAG
jgi:hypothetical protein